MYFVVALVERNHEVQENGCSLLAAGETVSADR
jgi:hypothetical protein